MNDNEPKVKSLYKALQLLDLFDTTNYELSVTYLAVHSKLLKSSVSNIMSTFEMSGYVEKNKSNGKYHLGKKFLMMSNIFTSKNTYQKTLKKYMTNLSNETNETVFYAIPYDTKIIYIDSAAPRDSMFNNAIQGHVAPMYCTGLGKAILAFSSDELIEKVISEGFNKYTEHTILDRETLLNELSKIRKDGYAIDNMEHEYGVKCVSLPFINDSVVVGSISISGPSLRFSDEKVNEYIIKLKRISKLMELE